MGYAGYVPAKLPPAALSPAEAALQAIKSVEALEVIGKLHYNLAVSPKEDKFRRIKLSNKKIAETVVAASGAVDALLALGWVADEAAADELVVPGGKYFSMAEVRMVEAAKELLKKAQEEAFKRDLRKSGSRSNLVTPVQA